MTLPPPDPVAQLGEGWARHLGPELAKDYMRELAEFLRAQRPKKICPSPGAIFAAFTATPLEQVRVVILGQDPYHGPDQAMGLSFSVPPSTPVPPSLRNIFREIASDCGGEPRTDGDLRDWAAQGVLLLNTIMTTKLHEAAAHRGRGWEQFTDEAIRTVSRERADVIFLLWGAPAGAKEPLIDTGRHHVLRAPHPSPLSAYRGFFGCGHFSEVNRILESQGQTPIAWAGSLP
ncbi:uracil-DNA glycosylase [Miltoncostaea oceani]|uniref:uracil-DNA glycosylase n=1 Tax=Miltoncostaea oceani TaxID=2843216 RepID=UPI001C3CDB7C|nr:uracil-DNA glycosylase [Miltoncostaea oceani]